MIDIRSKYHIAINDVGFVLQNAPQSPAYMLSQATLFNQRLAQGDRTYDDFAQWWYWAQTDWFQGLKDETSWEDDGKFYYSTNIDAWSEIGAIKLSPTGLLHATLTEEISCGAACSRGGSNNVLTIGTTDNASSKPVVYEWNGSSWADISSASFPDSQNIVSQIISRMDYTWVATVGNGMTWVLSYWDGSTFVDASSNAHSVLSLQMGSCRAIAEAAGKLYAVMDNSLNNYWAIVSCSAAAPTLDADWTKVVEYNESGIPVDICEYAGNLYYLVNRGYAVDLRVYDIANAIDTKIRTFNDSSISSWGVGGKLLKNYNGKLIITIPNKEIWEFDGISITRIFRTDDDKTNISSELIPYLRTGAVIKENKMVWGNLIYDGSHFYNGFKDSTDSSSHSIIPLFVDESSFLWYTDTLDEKKIYRLNYFSGGSTFKGVADKNYILFSNNDKISGVDKIAFSVTLLFKALASGQSIVVEYNTGEFTSITTGWTVLGTASYSLDGAATQKTLYFPVNTTYKKIWVRIKLAAGGSNTPALKDFVMAYLPTPYLDKLWSINIDCGNEIKLINGSIENRSGRELKGKLEAAWLTRQTLDYQDVDYASTTLKGALTAVATTIPANDTSQFPEVGRLRIGSETIYYTGKTPSSFTGCTRGVKGSTAAAHNNEAVVHNGYKVMIQNFQASVPIINSEKELEYVVALNLREIF